MPKSKTNQATLAIGVAWYQPDQWKQLCDVSVDRDELEDTYEEWVRDAERFIKRLRQEGFQVVKVEITIADLLLWCESQKIAVNSQARSKYAAFQLQNTG
jgi:predicted transcriptional regulator